MRRILSLSVFASLLLGACAPATVQLARTNGKGNFQFGIEPGVLAAAGSTGAAGAPSFNLAGRYGVSDQVDIGARIGTSLYELQFKYMFTDPMMTDEMALSIAPSTTLLGGGVGGVGAFYWSTRVPLLFGIPVGNGSEFTFGPAGTLLIVGGGGGGTGTGAVGLSLGGQVGYAAKVANNFRIVPQFDLNVPLIAAAAASGNGESAGGVAAGVGGVVVGLQLGFLIGGPVQR